MSGWYKPVLSASCIRVWDHFILAKISFFSFTGADFTDELAGTDSEVTAEGI